MDGWFGPKLTVRTSSRPGAGCSIVGIGRRDPRALVDRRPLPGAIATATPPPRSGPARRRSGSPCAAGGPPSRPPSGSARRFGCPSIADAHHVARLALVPVGGRPDRDDALRPARRRRARPGRVPAARPRRERAAGGSSSRSASASARGLRARPCRAGRVQVAAPGGADVAGDRPLVPAEVVGRSDVGEEAEAVLVAQVAARLDEPRRVDDERRLAVRLLRLDEARDPLVAQLATPRISYAGGTPARTFSCRRTIPSISALRPRRAAGHVDVDGRRSCRRPGGSRSC